MFAEQTMVPFQPVPGRQAKGAASNSGPDRSVNILHSFSARKSSSVLKMKCSPTCELLARNHRQSKEGLMSNKATPSQKKIFSLFLELFYIAHE